MAKKKGDKKPKKSAPRSAKKSKNDSGSVFLAFVATFLSIVGVLIVFLVGRDDKYAMHYAKQSLVIFVICVIVGILQWILVFIPVLGWIIATALNVLVLILWLISWIYALSGQQRRISIVSDYADKMRL